MKIVFTGGGTGGHFYPIVAVAQELHILVKEKKLLEPELYYIAPEPYDERALFENNIEFRKSPAGKLRRYFSLLNFFGIFKTGWGTIKALWQIFIIYPDVIFSKGGYASFPTVLAGKLFRIPVMIHESDVVPGKTNLWASKFAKRIAVSFEETARYFPKEAKIAHTGNPVRKELFTLAHEGAYEFLNLEHETPVILIMGGSQGSMAINDAVLGALPEMVENYQVIHQTGKKGFVETKQTADIVLEKSTYKHRYHPFDFLNNLALRMGAGVADLIVSRAGAGAIFEIAVWELPSIIVPIPESVSHDQTKNAFAYARTSGAVVVEQGNLTPYLLLSEINRIIQNEKIRTNMKKTAKKFSQPNAAVKVAEEIIDMALEHESN